VVTSGCRTLQRRRRQESHAIDTCRLNLRLSDLLDTEGSMSAMFEIAHGEELRGVNMMCIATSAGEIKASNGNGLVLA
jgi:hypothetical protein